MKSEEAIFSFLNTRLGRLEINYYGVREEIIKNKVKKAILITILLFGIGIATTYSKNFIGVYLSLVLSMPCWVHVISVIKYEPMQPKCNALVAEYLNRPNFMAKILRKEKTVFDLSTIADIDISNVSQEDFKAVEKFIFNYKVKRQLPFLIITSIVIGMIISSVFIIFNNTWLNLLNGVIATALTLVCLYYILAMFSNVAYKVIFKNFSKKVDKYYSLGAISELQYKVMHLYYSSYLLSSMFSVDDYDYFLEENLIDRYNIVTDYIGDCNFKRMRGVFSMGLLGVLFITYSTQPIMVMIPLLIACILALIVRIKPSSLNIDKYEEKLINDKPMLTAKIMKHMPYDFLENL